MVRRRQGTILPLIAIERDAATPIYSQMERQIRDAILSGVLKRGTRLPSSRAIAAELGISRPTVVQVLEALAGEGLLEVHRGSGTFVSSEIRLPPLREEARRTADGLSGRLSLVGRFALSRAADLGVADYRPFLPNFPAFDTFPWSLWRKIAGSCRFGAASHTIWRCTGAMPAIRSRS